VSQPFDKASLWKFLTTSQRWTVRLARYSLMTNLLALPVAAPVHLDRWLALWEPIVPECRSARDLAQGKLSRSQAFDELGNAPRLIEYSGSVSRRRRLSSAV
jgi:hypothetical protein